ncbi:hypothetical protein F0919_17785 [Taibaiella lutea]|uniref:Uncharacterized protein n=1 Tax=Taibaiella lutea TaxID=2608001 RepID=A0A5M6CCB4_9BACT|nr:hypothetical protein [Taibaiella lutea]KAA5532633.1 hypothetical protein F0919_17785 [Taibaiella lutea]
MEPIYKEENSLPGIKSIEIYEAVIEDDNSLYPIKVNQKDYTLRMNAEGFWRVEGLSEEMSVYIGELVEFHEL